MASGGPDVSLSTVFHACAPAGAYARDADLENALCRLVDEGRCAWPALDLSSEAFVRHVASRLVPGKPLDEVHAADLYLACACAERTKGAIEAFERTHMSRVGGFLSQLRPSPSFVDDVRQVLRERLFVGKGGGAPRIAEYTGRGALASWLRVMAVRAAIDLRRTGADDVAAGGDDPESRVRSAASDPELDYIKQRYREEFNEAIRRAVATLADEPRDLFQRHFVDGVTLDRLAADLGVHRATVARRVAAAREAVFVEVRRLLKVQLGARSAEIDSLVHLLRSQLELSLTALKKKTRDEP